ncbi:protein kinase domain-containing protein [Nonomuraea turcica]|uniref:protein kinase domain-containing protein n=1 Tax=Nonomuraea sp. G32 TaxID=3067274 RepID=UPI00273CB67F|nr:protein kinase [Nonomuraea sp. G32]MDP4504271.1 protein kinase [Nonomuraea sp. G32]
MRRDDDGERTATLGRSAGTPLEPEDPPAIGPYELVSRLGSGGMGVVYLAKSADGPRVALKAIRRDFTADPVYRARFHEEVSNARKVASFCTARVLDHGEDRGVLYLVTEYIDGISLEDHLIEHGALSPSVLHAAAVGVAAALTAIHAAGLVHRDLKPANVMLTLAGPRVIDFGLARSTHVDSRHTNAGMVMGTPGWIAPEQVFEGRTSPAGDVFAWGSLIAYAGLGGHPFGEGDAYVMAARARTAPPDLRGLPTPLDRLVAAAIHPDPARRPTARQLLLELVEAADEPAAQLAATKHLTNAWNPSEFAPHPDARPPHPDARAPRPDAAGPHPDARVPHPDSAGPRPDGAGRGPQPPLHPDARSVQAPPHHDSRAPQAAPHPEARNPQGPPAERTGPTPVTSRGPQPSPAERTGPTPGTGRGPQPPHADRTGPVPGAVPQPPHAERTGPVPGAMPQPPHAERTGPVPGAMPQPPHAERTGPVPGVGPQPPHAERTGPLPGTGRGPQTHGRGGQARHPERSMPRPGGRGPLPHHATTGQGPLPGYRPARPKRGVFAGCLTALVIAAVLLVLLLAALAWLFRETPAGADGPVEDGKLRFAVTSTKCPKPAKAATTRTCQIGVKVNNIGHEARVLYPGQQKLIDEDDMPHGGTKLLDKSGKEITPIRIEAGGAFTGTLVFELPKNLQPTGLEVHDSGLSAGARVNLDS